MDASDFERAERDSPAPLQISPARGSTPIKSGIALRYQLVPCAKPLSGSNCSMSIVRSRISHIMPKGDKPTIIEPIVPQRVTSPS